MPTDIFRPPLTNSWSRWPEYDHRSGWTCAVSRGSSVSEIIFLWIVFPLHWHQCAYIQRF